MNPHNLLDLGLEGFRGEFFTADNKYITEVESLISFYLPNDYKDFLRKCGVSLFTEYVAFCPLELSPWCAGPSIINNPLD
jgi:hypothetical protein